MNKLCLIFPALIMWGILFGIYGVILIVYFINNWNCDIDDLDEDKREYH